MAGTTNDDDLLILSDDTDSGTDFVLDDTIITDNESSSNSEDLISFDTDLSNFGNSEIKVEEVENINSTDGFSLDLSDSNVSETVLPIIEEEVVQDLPLNNSNNDDNLSFGIDEESETNNDIVLESEKKEEVAEDTFVFGTTNSEEVKTTSIGTMTDILDDTIAKFSKREEMIGNDIKSREEHVLSLKAEIAELEGKVTSENEEVSKLNSEKQAIVKNRKSLEKMKSDMTTAPTVK
ncbi:MAG: hypothetical protein PHV23_00380 [Candidatus Gracilibacteria bacterium]|nr:hypothetical protein [Candidatus Gracilibacteria bacterium]